MRQLCDRLLQANHGATQAGHNSSLPECAAEGDLEGVKRLLNLGEDVDSIDEQGNTALHFSAENGFEEIAALLLSRRADANAANEDGDTPLHKATISNYINILALLVAGQADVNAQVRLPRVSHSISTGPNLEWRQAGCCDHAEPHWMDGTT